MLMIISQNPGHKDAPQWVQDLRTLLTTPPESLTAETAPPPGTTPPPEPPEAGTPAGESPEPVAENRPVVPERNGPGSGRRPRTAFPPNFRPGR